tara:strand:+ start:1970 stop:2602 length:633 start_codon:yes stop_codon:yes gene_type:complete
MPKLSYPKDMSDLTGEALSPDPIRDNIQSIDDLVNGEGLDWENISQWSLDHGHVYPREVLPGDPEATKGAISVRSGGYMNPAAIPTVFTPNTWLTVSPIGEQNVNVNEGSAAFIYGSHHIGFSPTFYASSGFPVVQYRLQTKLSGASGWGWTTLRETTASGGAVQTIIGAVKCPGSGILSVRLRIYVPMLSASHPTEWGFSNLSVFVINQ